TEPRHRRARRGAARLAAVACAAFGITAGPRAAGAQTAPIAPTLVDAQNYWPIAGPASGVVLRASHLQPHLTLGFSALLNFMYRPLILRDPTMPTGDPINGMSYALTTDFLWTFGLFNRLQLDLAVPVVAAQSGAGVAPLTLGGQAAELPTT